MIKNRHLSEDEFFSKIKSTFGDIYDYSKAVYVDSKHKIKLYCKKCDIWFEKRTTALLKGKGCPYCVKGQPDTYKAFVEKAKKIHGDKYEYNLESFSFKNRKVRIYCKHCKTWFNQLKSSHLNGKGCINCSGTKRYTNEEFIEKSKEIHGKKTFNYDLCNYNGMTHKVKLKCNNCSEEFEILPINHIHKKHGCPNCGKVKSKGETCIKKYLSENNIRFEEQKCFRDCKNKRELPFDFYLLDYNTCIEYQGKQHYFPSDYFGGEVMLKYRQECDKIKKAFCKKHNIVLLEIKYNDNIENILNRFLKSFVG